MARWWPRLIRAAGAVAVGLAVAVAGLSLFTAPAASAEAPAATQVAGDPTGPTAAVPVVKAVPAAGATSVASGSRCGKGGFRGKVNLNTATAADLDLLPGIGPAKAQRIVDWRTRHGRFHRIKDLRRVKGFGRKSVLKLWRHLAIEGPAVQMAPVATRVAAPAIGPPSAGDEEVPAVGASRASPVPPRPEDR